MFGKFMNKKFFHPGSYPNVKMRWIHEQRDAAKKKLEEEKQGTYQKEQESYQSRLLSANTTEEKMKLDLNFLYDLPPGMKTDEKDQEEDKDQELKFEWQKHAPRSKYINDLGLECADQPFGVCVRNIRCFKCRAWGHQNTDRECPLFFSNVNSEAEGKIEGKRNLRLSDPLLLVVAMKEQHGISLKKSVIGKEIDPMADNQQLIPSDDDNEELGSADLEFVESLTKKQKRRLLKRLNKLEKNEQKETKKKTKSVKSETNYHSSSEDYAPHRKKEKLAVEDNVNKAENNPQPYKKPKSKNYINSEVNSKVHIKHKTSDSKYDSDEFDFINHAKLKHSADRDYGENSGYYKERRKCDYDKNWKGDDNYSRRDTCRNKNSIDDPSLKKHIGKQEYIHTGSIDKEEKHGIRREIYRESRNEKCHTGKERKCSDNTIKITKRKSSRSYDSVDEKIYEIRNDIINSKR